MMKKLFLPFLIILCAGNLSAQNFVSLIVDPSGDDHYMDAKEVRYATNSTNDSLFIRIYTYNPRGGDFGYAVALDTNLNTQDGNFMPQHNLKNQTPNNSMSYDLALYGYQNGFFPGVYTEAYDGNGSASTIGFSFDTTDAHFATFGVSLNDIGGNYDVNIIAFTGSFDISPVGAGPSDAIPDATFGSLRTSELSLLNKKVSKVSLYPNPAKDHVFIKSPSGESSFILRDLSGKRIMDIDLTHQNYFSVSHLKGGLYILSSTENTSETVKIFVEN